MGGANEIVLSLTLLTLFCVLDLVNLPCCIEWGSCLVGNFRCCMGTGPGLGESV